MNKSIFVLILTAVLIGTIMTMTTNVYATISGQDDESGTIRDSDERDTYDTEDTLDIHGEFLSIDVIKKPDQWPQLVKEGKTFVACHPLSPCWVSSFEDLKKLLEEYPLAVIGVNPYHLYDSPQSEQDAQDKKWLTPLGVKNFDEVMD